MSASTLPFLVIYVGDSDSIGEADNGDDDHDNDQSSALLLPTLIRHSLSTVISFFRALKPTSLLFSTLHNFPALPFLPAPFPTGQF